MPYFSSSHTLGQLLWTYTLIWKPQIELCNKGNSYCFEHIHSYTLWYSYGENRASFTRNSKLICFPSQFFHFPTYSFKKQDSGAYRVDLGIYLPSKSPFIIVLWTININAFVEIHSVLCLSSLKYRNKSEPRVTYARNR